MKCPTCDGAIDYLTYSSETRAVVYESYDCIYDPETGETLRNSIIETIKALEK